MGGGQLQYHESEAITRNGRQDNDDQDDAGPITIGSVRKHADMITSELGLGKRKIDS